MYTCVAIDDELHAREALERCIQQIPDLKLIGSYESPLQFYGKKQEVDIVFSDIQMPDMDGIAFVKSMKNPPVFIFVTGNPAYAVESYELDVLDFIVKPFDLRRFIKSVDKAFSYLKSKRTAKPSNDFLIVRDRNQFVVTDFSGICYIKGNKDYVTVYSLEKEYVLWRTLGSMEAELPTEKFIRVQKSFIVNIAFVKTISANKIKLKGNLGEIPVGGHYQDELFRRFGIN